MSKWIGYAVSVNCGEPLGCYQGTILEADGTTITLTKAFRNGFPYPKSQVTLNAADIKELKIIESQADRGEQTHSTVAVAKGNKKSHRATVCESLQANQTNSGNQTAVAGGKPAPPARSKPIDIQPRPAARAPHNHAGSHGGGSTPKGRGGGGGGADKARRRNEACFGSAADVAIDDDFDFEGNLALFDKRALWERMRRPDLLRGAPADKYRHDEPVLAAGAGAAAGAALRVPDALRGPLDYVTDEGVAVCSVAPALRRALWDGLQRLGLLEWSQALLARAAADVALRLVGGGRRLEPRNAHQAPCVVALAGAHAAGAAGLAAARLLASHGAPGGRGAGRGGAGGLAGGPAAPRPRAAGALRPAGGHAAGPVRRGAGVGAGRARGAGGAGAAAARLGRRRGTRLRAGTRAGRAARLARSRVLGGRGAAGAAVRGAARDVPAAVRRRGAAGAAPGRRVTRRELPARPAGNFLEIDRRSPGEVYLVIIDVI